MSVLKAILCLGYLLLLTGCRTPSQVASPVPTSDPPPTQTMFIETPADDTATPFPSPLPSSSVTPDVSSATPSPPDEQNEQFPFTATFGGERHDRGINLIQTMDGGFAIIGYTNSFDTEQEDMYLVRLDPEGNSLWSATYGGERQDNGWAILETEDNGFVILGFTSSFGMGGMDMYLLRTDARGEVLWERTFGGVNDEFGWAMAQVAGGGYVLAGQTDSVGQGEEDGYLVRVNEMGEELWSQTFGGPQEDRLFSVDADNTGGFILAGTTRSYGAGNRDAYMVHTNSSGEMDWEKVFGEEEDDVAHSVRTTNEGGFFLTGYTRSFGANGYDSWIIKTEPDGSVQWQQIFGGENDDRTIFGEQTSDGGFILTGFSRSFNAQDWDVFLVKTDASGEPIWLHIYGGAAEDTGYTVHETTGLGFILTGETYSFGAGSGDMFFLHVDENGVKRDG